jgi:hypothetical protein
MKQAAAPLLLTLILGLVLGAAGGALFLGSGGGPQASTAEVGRPQGEGASRPAAPGPEAIRAPTAAALTAGTAAAATELDPADRRLATAVAERVAAAAPAAAAQGEGALWGTVTGLDGQPLAGVRIYAEPYTSGQPSDPRRALEDSARRTVDEDLSEVASKRLEVRRGRRQTESGTDGGYRLEGLPDGRWTVSGYLEGYAVRAARARSATVRTGSGLDLLAEPLLPLPVEVVDASGALVDEAVLHLEYHSGEHDADSFVRWTPDSPQLYLVPNTYDLRALVEPLTIEYHEDTATGKSVSERQSVNLAPGRAAETVRLVLGPAEVLYGRVTLDPGVEVQDSLRVMVSPYSGEDPPPEGVEYDSEQSKWLRAGGEYVRRDLAPGRYLVSVLGGWQGPRLAYAIVDYPGGILRRDIQVGVDEQLAQSFCSLRLSDDSGLPVRNVQLGWMVRTTSSSSSSHLSARVTDGAHRFALPSQALDGFGPDERIAITIQREGYPRAEVELVEGVLEYEYRFEPPALAIVTVTGAGGSGVRELLHIDFVSLDEPSAERTYFSHDRASLDASGIFRSSPLVPGRYRMSLQMLKVPGQTWSGNELRSSEVALVSGENRLSVAVPPLHSLSVRTPDHADGAQFRLRSVQEAAETSPFLHSFRSLSAAVQGGKVQFEHLAEGRYVLSSNDFRGAQMEVEVPCSELTFAGEVPNAARVSISDPAGRLAAMGLRDGDLVLAADDVDFATPGTAARGWQVLSQGTGERRLTVLRGGAVQTLTYDSGSAAASALGAALNMGGSLTPVYVAR